MGIRRLLVGQSGGPTAAINASLAGVVETARALGIKTLGMRHGVEGLLEEDVVDLDLTLPTAAHLQLLRQTPASYLGSCRFKLPDMMADPAPYRDLFSYFDINGIDAVLYIGGNDSMDTISKLAAYGEATGSSVRFIGGQVHRHIGRRACPRRERLRPRQRARGRDYGPRCRLACRIVRPGQARRTRRAALHPDARGPGGRGRAGRRRRR